MGLSWPSAYDWLWDKAQQYWPKADESGLRTAQQSFIASLSGVESALSDLASGHQDLVKALGQSDSAGAAQTRLTDIQGRSQTLNQIILAEMSLMSAAPANVDTAKQGLIDKAKTADSNAKSGVMGFLAEYIPSIAQSQKDKAAAQFDSDAKPVHSTYTQSNQGLLKLPDGVEGGDGPVKSGANYETGTDISANPVVARSNLDQGSVKNNSPGVTSNSNLDQASVKDNTPIAQNANYEQGQQASNGAAATSSSAGASQVGSGGGSNASGGAGGGNGSTGGASGASTGLQSGAALAEHSAPAAPTSPAGDGGGGRGGIGAPPSIGGIGGGPAGGAGGPARIGGIGGGPGGGAEAPRTGAQGASAVEKSSGSSSSSGSGERQGSGLSRGGGAGAGAAGAATHTQSAQQGALRDAMKGDTAGGASNTGKHLDQQNQALGTGKITELSPTALQSAHGETAKVKSALSGLEGQLAASHPAAASGQLASWIVAGGVVEGARRAGFLADGVTWGWVPQAPFEHTGLDGLVFLFEDMRVSPNKDSGVFRPVAARVTTTGWLGEIDPAMRLPEGTRILDRAKAPAGTDHLTDAGLLARGLARWLLEAGLDGDQSWRLVAVCFLEEPDVETVDGLLRLAHPVEAFWPDRPGYEATVPQAAVEDARTLSSEELEVKQKDPLRHATDVARLAPDGLYDPTGLAPKEAAWYRKSAERAQRELLTNARWKQELDQYLREERGGGSPNW